MALTIADATRNQMVQQIQIDIDAGAGAGTVEFKTAASTVAGTNEIATVTFSDPSFPAAATGAITANDFTVEASASAGTATDFTIFDSNSVAIIQGSVGAGSGDINMSSNVFGAGDTVDITSMVFTMPAS